MVLREIIEAWKSKDLLVQVYETFESMLTETEEMFSITHQVMYEGADKAPLTDKLYEIDIVVNKSERQVRRQVVEHMAIRPGQDMPASLVLMSIVKDAERLGDYCKNLVQAYELLDSIQEDDYTKQFSSIHDTLKTMFINVRKAIHAHEEELATNAIKTQISLGKTSDTIITQLSQSKVSTQQAVAYALIARFYKRMACHLSNIATSVVAPVHKIDYYYEKDEDDNKRYIK